MGKSKVLIIGGTGIIGTHLSHAAINNGFEVYVVSRGHKKLVEGVNTISCDAYDAEKLDYALGTHTFNAVIDLLSFDDLQITGLFNIINKRCHQYIFVSSSTIFREPRKGKISENSELISDGWDYPLRKIKAEKALVDLSKNSASSYTIVRPYITYSEQRLSFGIWEGFGLVEAIKNGKPIALPVDLEHTKTSLTHSKDLARAIVGLINNPIAFNQDFNVATEESITWKELYETVAKVVGTKLHLVSVDTDNFLHQFPELSGKLKDRLLDRTFSSKKLSNAIPNFEFEYNVESGYKKLILQGIKASEYQIDYIAQGRIDSFTYKSGNKQSKKRIKRYKKNLLRETPKNYIQYTIGYYALVYRLAYLAKQILKPSSTSRYR